MRFAFDFGWSDRQYLAGSGGADEPAWLTEAGGYWLTSDGGRWLLE